MPESYTQLQPDSTGAKIRARLRTIGSNDVQEFGMQWSGMPTYYVLAESVAPALNKNMLTVTNASGSGLFLTMKKIFIINMQEVAVTGARVRMNAYRYLGVTAHTGTALTPEKPDSESANLPAQVTITTGSSITAATSNIMFPLTFATDEALLTQTSNSQQILAGFNWAVAGEEVQELRIREGEGFGIRNMTNTTVGSLSFLLVFTAVEA